MEKVKSFSRHSKDNYKIIDINTEHNLGGDFGDVYNGNMINTNSPHISIPVILKTYKKNCECKLKDVKKTFNHEKDIFKFLSKPENTSDSIVKCYGITKINRKEYIVMEDLKAQGFETIADVCNKQEKPTEFNIATKAEYEQYKQKVLKFSKATNKLKTLKEILIQIPIEHNDIHRGNVMINLDTNEVKLIDLGLSTKKHSGNSNYLGKIDGGGYENIQYLFRSSLSKTFKEIESLLDDYLEDSQELQPTK